MSENIIIEIKGKKFELEDTDNLFLDEGHKGINPNYMKDRIVYKNKVKSNSHWGLIQGCYRRQEEREDEIAFTVIPLGSLDEVNWDIKDCIIVPKGFKMV